MFAADFSNDTSHSPTWAAHAPRRLLALLDLQLNKLLPLSVLSDSDLRQRARTFVLSHVCGPVLGVAIIGYLWSIDPDPTRRLIIPLGCVLAFWLFPVALRLTTRLGLLSVLSIQNLAFIILFVSYEYGGVSSPFLPWLVTLPFLAFFYLGEAVASLWLVLAILGVDLAAFFLAHRLAGPPSIDLDIERLTPIAIVSLFLATLYATAMAAYYVHVVASRNELAGEVQSHRATTEALKEAREMAEAASRAKTEFLAMISHELRTPLNAIIGFSEIMSNQTFGSLGERYIGYANDILQSGGHLLGIINDILDIAKAESGTLELDDEIFNCRDVIIEAQRMLQRRIDEAGVTVEVAFPLKLPHVRADRRRTRQVVLNLLHNAIKYTPRGGGIFVSLSVRRLQELVITVRDTGVGIAEENLERVVQPFVQVDRSLSRRQEGTGLGLPLVSILMRRQGGRFELASQVGKGTTARAFFPEERLVYTFGEPTSNIDDTEPRRSDRQRRAIVMIVDDDENLRMLLARMLVRNGYEAITAIHGLDALRCLCSKAVDLVVTNMLMPEMDGAELLRTLRIEHPSLPVIAMSGAEDWKEYLRFAANLGAKAALQKPISEQQLLGRVREVLDGSPAANVAEEVRSS